MNHFKLFAALIIVFIGLGSNRAEAYTCYAKALGGSKCGGSYTGYSNVSKSYAIRDALDSCKNSNPGGCRCVFDSCTGRTEEVLGYDDGLDDIIDPAGEHDHFLGTVIIQGTGKRAFPDAGPADRGLFGVYWASAKEQVSKAVSALEFDTRTVQVYPLKSSPQVSWYFQCPAADSRCYCGNGKYYSRFLVGSHEAKNQKFSVSVPTGRLDINDMTITRQDGSTYQAKGKYVVSMLTKVEGHERWCAILSDAATKSGVDVPRGFKYSVVTRAVSEEGSTLSSTQEVDLR